MEAITANIATLKDAIGGWPGTLLAAVIIVAVTIVVSRLVAAFLNRVLSHDGTPLPSSSIFLNIARGVVWVVGASILLGTCFGIDVSALITALGVGGIAVSLGFQDTISNFFGGLQLSLMRIVEPGDNVRVGSDTGVVRDVTWRHTTIVTATGEVVIIPNSVINKSSLTKLAPPETVVVPFVCRLADETPESVHADIERAANEAATAVCPLQSEAKVLFTEVTEWGLRGKIILRASDAAQTAAVADAVVQAISPFLQPKA